MKTWMYILILLVVVGGCVTGDDGKRTLDPNIEAAADKVADVGLIAVSAGQAFSGLWPPLAGVLTVASLIFGGWKSRKASNAYGLTQALVTSIEAWKKERPDDWLYLEAKLTKAIGPQAENIIRAMRGMPAKK